MVPPLFGHGLPGPPPGARPGCGARRQVPGGQAFDLVFWSGWAQPKEPKERGTPFQTASKRFWTTVRHWRKGKQCAVNTVYSGDSVLLTSTRGVVDRWSQSFEDLNPTNAASGEEAGPGTRGWAPLSLRLPKGPGGGRDPPGDPYGPGCCGAVGADTTLQRREGQRGRCRWIGRPGRWSVFLRRGTEGCVLSLPGKVYSGVLERSVCQIQEELCGFRRRGGTVDQLYTLSRVLEGAWEFAQPVHMGFVDLEKSELPCSGCSPREPILDKRWKMDGWMDGCTMGVLGLEI